MEKFVPCRNCLNKNVSLKSGKPIAPPGYIVEKSKAVGTLPPNDEVRECECHVRWRKKYELETLAKRASLNVQWIDYDPEKDYVGTESKNEVERIIKFVKRSVNPNETADVKSELAASVIYMYGTNGTQKTTLANWMGFEFLKAKKSVRYILMNELIKMLQKADRDEQIQAVLEKLEDVDLLLIDEAFDKSKITLYKSAYQIPFIDTFLRNRLQTKHKGIVFISNVSPFDIENNGFNHSIEDLVVRTMKNHLMEFKDRYDSIMSDVNIDDLF